MQNSYRIRAKINYMSIWKLDKNDITTVTLYNSNITLHNIVFEGYFTFICYFNVNTLCTKYQMQ